MGETLDKIKNISETANDWVDTVTGIPGVDAVLAWMAANQDKKDGIEWNAKEMELKQYANKQFDDRQKKYRELTSAENRPKYNRWFPATVKEIDPDTGKAPAADFAGVTEWGVDLNGDGVYDDGPAEAKSSKEEAEEWAALSEDQGGGGGGGYREVPETGFSPYMQDLSHVVLWDYDNIWKVTDEFKTPAERKAFIEQVTAYTDEISKHAEYYLKGIWIDEDQVMQGEDALDEDGNPGTIKSMAAERNALIESINKTINDGATALALVDAIGAQNINASDMKRAMSISDAHGFRADEMEAASRAKYIAVAAALEGEYDLMKAAAEKANLGIRDTLDAQRQRDFGTGLTSRHTRQLQEGILDTYMKLAGDIGKSKTKLAEDWGEHLKEAAELHGDAELEGVKAIGDADVRGSERTAESSIRGTKYENLAKEKAKENKIKNEEVVFGRRKDAQMDGFKREMYQMARDALQDKALASGSITLQDMLSGYRVPVSMHEPEFAKQHMGKNWDIAEYLLNRSNAAGKEGGGDFNLADLIRALELLDDDEEPTDEEKEQAKEAKKKDDDDDTGLNVDGWTPEEVKAGVKTELFRPPTDGTDPGSGGDGDGSGSDLPGAKPGGPDLTVPVKTLVPEDDEEVNPSVPILTDTTPDDWVDADGNGYHDVTGKDKEGFPPVLPPQEPATEEPATEEEKIVETEEEKIVETEIDTEIDTEIVDTKEETITLPDTEAKEETITLPDTEIDTGKEETIVVPDTEEPKIETETETEESTEKILNEVFEEADTAEGLVLPDDKGIKEEELITPPPAETVVPGAGTSGEKIETGTSASGMEGNESLIIGEQSPELAKLNPDHPDYVTPLPDSGGPAEGPGMDSSGGFPADPVELTLEEAMAKYDKNDDGLLSQWEYGQVNDALGFPIEQVMAPEGSLAYDWSPNVDPNYGQVEKFLNQGGVDPSTWGEEYIEPDVPAGEVGFTDPNKQIEPDDPDESGVIGATVMTEYYNPATGETAWTSNSAQRPPAGFIPVPSGGIPQNEEVAQAPPSDTMAPTPGLEQRIETPAPSEEFVPQQQPPLPRHEPDPWEDFVTGVYQDDLGRMPDPGGLEYWADIGNAGTPLDTSDDLTQEEVNQMMVQAALANGEITEEGYDSYLSRHGPVGVDGKLLSDTQGTGGRNAPHLQESDRDPDEGIEYPPIGGWPEDPNNLPVSGELRLTSPEVLYKEPTPQPPSDGGRQEPISAEQITKPKAPADIPRQSRSDGSFSDDGGITWTAAENPTPMPRHRPEDETQEAIPIPNATGTGEAIPIPNATGTGETTPLSSELTDGTWREDHPLGTVWEGDLETSSDGSVGRWIQWEGKWMFEGDNGWMYDQGSQQWLFPQSGGSAWNDKIIFQTETGEFYSADQVAKLPPEKWTNLATPQIQQENLDFIDSQTPSAPQEQVFDAPPSDTMPRSPGLEQINVDPNLVNPSADPGKAPLVVDPGRPPENIDDIIAEINKGFPPELQDPYVDPIEGTDYDWANADGNLVVPGESGPVGDSNQYGQ